MRSRSYQAGVKGTAADGRLNYQGEVFVGRQLSAVDAAACARHYGRMLGVRAAYDCH